MKFKIPNILTIGRIIIVPIFVLTFFIPGFFGDLIPFFLFVLASFTDYLDGLLARLFKEESKLGELLDPIADKILVSTALVLLIMNGTIKNFEVDHIIPRSKNGADTYENFQLLCPSCNKMIFYENSKY